MILTYFYQVISSKLQLSCHTGAFLVIFCAVFETFSAISIAELEQRNVNLDSVNFYDNSKEDVLNDDFQSLLLKPFVHEKAIISIFFLFWDYMNRFFRPKHWREQ